MADSTSSEKTDRSSLQALVVQNWMIIAAAIVALVLLILVLPRIAIWWALYWSSDAWKKLFYEDLGFSDAVSSLLATAFSFVYVFAWLPLGYLSFKRYKAKGFAVVFGSWLFVYGAAPALHAALGRDICFNQATGEPEKWYVMHNGSVVLFDSSGYDSFGVKKNPVTQQVCETYAQQRTGAHANLISTDARHIEFFDPTTGVARVWYDRDATGKIRFFDAPGFDPEDGAELMPVTNQIAIEAIRSEVEEEKKASAAAIAPVVAPSFDCSAATDPIPKLICTNASLAEADNEMAAAYTTALAAVPDSQALRQNQREWLKMRNASAANVDLILQQLNERTSYLQTLTQNATAVTLPDTGGASSADGSQTGSSTIAEGEKQQSPQPVESGQSESFSSQESGVAQTPSPAPAAPVYMGSYQTVPHWGWRGRPSFVPQQYHPTSGFTPARPTFVQQRRPTNGRWPQPQRHRNF